MCSLSLFPRTSEHLTGQDREVQQQPEPETAYQLFESFPVLYQPLKPNLQNLCCWPDLLSAQIPMQDNQCNGFVIYTDTPRGLDWDWTLCEAEYKNIQPTSEKYLEKNCHALENSEVGIPHQELK